MLNRKIPTSKKYFRRLWGLIAIGIIFCFLSFSSVLAADKIYFSYSSLQQSLNINSLERFAQNGTVNKDLEFYFRVAGANQEEIAVFRQQLTEKIKVDPLLLSRFLKTDEGERLLSLLGQIINIQGGKNGEIAIRGAVTLAAFDSKGLTLLNVLHHFPVNIQIKLEKAITVANDAKFLLNITEQFVEKIAQLSTQESQYFADINYHNLPDLRRKGKFTVEEKKLFITNNERKRQFYAIFYQPTEQQTGQIPVVIFSHGLGAEPDDYAEQAKHLASYGFFVVLPQHEGSDTDYSDQFKQGYASEIFAINEFIDRPLDIKDTLDELERQNKTQFNNQLNLTNVGIYGHSFGGYTALALSGASPTPNFSQLEEDCQNNSHQFNVALLLQCRALQLHDTRNFRDPRIQAVVAANPVNASIFGEKALSQIKIPILLGAESYDPLAPFVFEQLRSFPWLTSVRRYFVLVEGQTHIDISKLDGGTSKLLKVIPKLYNPNSENILDYEKAMMVAFFQVYIAKNPDYLVYLKSSYTNYLSQEQNFKIYMITGSFSKDLNNEIKKLK